ncbi:MAG: hypothetical protein JWO86_2403, partial [Myxococcaceae bacterium]|nr:hypothetical protein [Myxococcaceae bacterium]
PTRDGQEDISHASATQTREELILAERRRGGAFDLRLNAGSGVACSPYHPTNGVSALSEAVKERTL